MTRGRELKPTKASNRIVLAYSGSVNASVQKHVSGTARFKLFRGHSEVVECRSPFALSAVDPRPTTDVVAARS